MLILDYTITSPLKFSTHGRPETNGGDNDGWLQQQHWLLLGQAVTLAVGGGGWQWGWRVTMVFMINK
jgi:hypothetical protein